MADRHFAHWPRHAPRQLWVPQTHLYRNAEVAALRYPDKPFVVYYDSLLTFAQFHQQCLALAGWLQQCAGVQKGDRVLLCMQNSPQFMVGYYAILRADAVVVPVNPMNLTDELRHLATDSGARVALVAQELYARMQPLLGCELAHLLVACYGDAVHSPTDLAVPEVVRAPRMALPAADAARGATAWADALAQQRAPGPLTAGPHDLAVMPYTSGTTGHPKGCMHTHHSTMVNVAGGPVWSQGNSGTVGLGALPMFHATGMLVNLNSALYTAATTVLLTRWDRDVALALVQRYRVTGLALITTMAIDFMAHPGLAQADLSSVKRIGGGGAAMPRAVAQQIEQRLGLQYGEGYGLSETMATSHSNPPDRPKAQCLGIPFFNVDSRVVDPATLQELPAGETGEILIHGPQVMLGYWNQPEATAEAFVQLDGKRFLRSGDLGYVDEEGYFFFVDRLKRMINAAGFKVWPAEVEALLYQHPAVQEACIIAAQDARRGETVKAVVVLKPAAVGSVSEQAITDWAHEHMAAYKVPRIVQFVQALPKSASGKVMWRTLQEEEARLSSL